MRVRDTNLHLHTYTVLLSRGVSQKLLDGNHCPVNSAQSCMFLCKPYLMIGPIAPCHENPWILRWIYLSIHRHFNSRLLLCTRNTIFREFCSHLFLCLQKSNYSQLLAHVCWHQLLCHSFARITPSTRTLATRTFVYKFAQAYWISTLHIGPPVLPDVGEKKISPVTFETHLLMVY